jgi:hypothetical protein
VRGPAIGIDAGRVGALIFKQARDLLEPGGHLLIDRGNQSRPAAYVNGARCVPSRRHGTTAAHLAPVGRSGGQGTRPSSRGFSAAILGPPDLQVMEAVQEDHP